jgi:hypothetical protein
MIEDSIAILAKTYPWTSIIENAEKPLSAAIQTVASPKTS